MEADITVMHLQIKEHQDLLGNIRSLEGRNQHCCHLKRNSYTGQEIAVRTRHETTDWFKIGKRVWQGCILSPCLFNLHAEYIVWNAGVDESQAGIKIAGRNINNLRYADDTTLMAESEEELKSLLMKVKEESEKAGLRLNIQQTKIMASGSITSQQIQFSSFAQSCPTLCDPMDCSMSGLPVHRQLPEFTQTHVHWVSDAIQSSHPLSSPSPPAFNLSQHQGLFKRVGEKVEAVTDFLFLGSKITVDGDFSHEVKRYWLLRRKTVTNLDSILKGETSLC